MSRHEQLWLYQLWIDRSHAEEIEAISGILDANPAMAEARRSSGSSASGRAGLGAGQEHAGGDLEGDRSQFHKELAIQLYGANIDSAVKSARIIPGAKDVYYPGAPHGITTTHQDEVNAELLAFLRN